jgi:hypothetical protein
MKMGRARGFFVCLPAPLDGFAAHIGIIAMPRWCIGLAIVAGRDMPERENILILIDSNSTTVENTIASV